MLLSLAWYRFPHVEQQRPGLTGLGSHEWKGVHLTLWLKERLLTPLLGFLPAPFPRTQTKLTSAFSGTQPVSVSFAAVTFTYRPPERRQVHCHRPTCSWSAKSHVTVIARGWLADKMMNRTYLQIVFLILTIFSFESCAFKMVALAPIHPLHFCIWSIIVCITCDFSYI